MKRTTRAELYALCRRNPDKVYRVFQTDGEVPVKNNADGRLHYFTHSGSVYITVSGEANFRLSRELEAREENLKLIKARLGAYLEAKRGKHASL